MGKTELTMTIHAIAVTFRRNDQLRETLTLLQEQTLRPDSLTIVDNAADDKTKEVAAAFFATYLRAPENLGPAGALDLAMTGVLNTADDDDWFLIIDDDNPPPTKTTIAEVFAAANAALDPSVAAVGTAGGWFDRQWGLLRRPDDSSLTGLIEVDAIGGGQYPLYRCGAVRAAGPVRADLFFGFEELEFGLRLQDHGYRLVVPADIWLANRRRLGRMGINARQAVANRVDSSWRRYYSTRNLIWISRRYGGPFAALITTARSGVLAAMAAGWRGRSVRAAMPGLRGVVDAWRGHLGRVVDPTIT